MAQRETIFRVDASPGVGFELRALGHAIFTKTDSIEELKTMLRDRVAGRFSEDAKPQVIRPHRVGDGVRRRSHE